MNLSSLSINSQAQAEVLGIDLARAEDGDLALVHGGLAYQAGEAVAVADITERIRTERGTEFYDAGFGETIDNWVEDEDTEINRLQMLAQLQTAIQADPRVVDRSATAKITNWTNLPRYLRIAAGWTWITGEKAANLVLVSDDDGTRIISSYNPTSAAEV